MVWPVLAGIGTALNIFGGLKSRADSAAAQRRNAEVLFEQADFLEQAGEREAGIFSRQLSRVEGAQISHFAKAGVDLSGSAMTRLAFNLEQGENELEAIKENTSMQVKLARLRAESSLRGAEASSDITGNILSAGGSLLTGVGGILRGLS